MMVGAKASGVEIREFMMNTVATQCINLSQKTQEHFGISKQSVSYHIQKLVKDGLITEFKDGRNKNYFLSRERLVEATLDNSSLEEDRVWSELVRSHVTDLPANVFSILHYGFCEMFNNAIDHSESETITVQVERSLLDIVVTVSDKGEGIFRRIARLKGFYDEKESVFQLTKGKLTTDPERHSGEGIFFTSRVFDKFTIKSGDCYFGHAGELDIIFTASESVGTNVSMRIANSSPTTIEQIFKEYANPDTDPSFNKTVVPIFIADHNGDGLISRSQARRIMSGVDKFKTVVLDFSKVRSIGQAFSDEIFRVFTNSHPDIDLKVKSASKRVQSMIDRAIANSGTR